VRLDQLLHQVGLLGEGNNVKAFDDLDGAMAWAEDRLLARHLVDPTPERALGLGEIDVLKSLPAAGLAALEKIAVVRTFRPGESLFLSGDEGHELYFVRRGRISIRASLARGGTVHVATFCRGDFLGDMAFLDARPRSADAVAATEAEVFVVTRQGLSDAMAADPVFGARFFEALGRAMAARLRASGDEIRSLQEG
jgi:SulP family sulfate permease